MAQIVRRSRIHRLAGGDTLRTSVPQVIGELLEVAAGDELEWSADTATGRVSVRKAPEDDKKRRA